MFIRYTFKFMFLFCSKMIKYVEGARKSLDICLYLLTCEDLCNSILNSFKRGVCVRVVTDCDMSLSTGSKMNELRKRGLCFTYFTYFKRLKLIQSFGVGLYVESK